MVDFNRFNGGRIVVPEDHLGDPMKFPGVRANPFDDLDKASGSEHSDPDLRMVGDLTREVQGAVQSLMVITPGSVLSMGSKRMFSFIDSDVKDRVGESLFYVGADSGQDFYQGKVGFGVLQNIGSCDQFTRDTLDKRRNKALEAVEHHDDFAVELIDAPRGSLILETGAGSDFGRIRKMQEYAARAGAKLICHDTAPLASKRSVDYLHEVLYLALPSSSELLSLPLADLKKPITITLKDVVSGMAFGQLMELCELAKNVHAKKIVVTQSLALARENNMIPENWKFSSPNFTAYIMRSLISHFMNAGFQNGKEVGAYVTLQVQHVIEVVMMELAKRSMAESARRVPGFANSRVLNVEESVVLEERAAGEYLSKMYPELVPEFLNGELNRISSGPFGTSASKSSGMQKNCLRVSSLRTHWEFSKGDVADIKSVRKSSPANISVTMPSQINIPREFLAVEKFTSLGTLRHVGIEEKALRSFSDGKFRELNKIGASLALNLIFNVWARNFGHPGILPFIGRVEKEMQDTFVKGI